MPPRYLQQGLRALTRADQPLRGDACPFTKSPSPLLSMRRSSSVAAATRAAQSCLRRHPCTRLDDSICQSVRAHSLEVTWAARCATLGVPGAHPRADEPYAVLGENQHAASLAQRAT